MPAWLNLRFFISFFLGSYNFFFSQFFLILKYTEINSWCFLMGFLVKDRLIPVKFLWIIRLLLTRLFLMKSYFLLKPIYLQLHSAHLEISNCTGFYHFFSFPCFCITVFFNGQPLQAKYFTLVKTVIVFIFITWWLSK